jgi:hypothetical protein
MPLTRVFRVDVGPVLLLLFGAFTVAGSGFNLWSELALRRSWPQIEGVSRGAVTYRTGSGQKSSNVRVTFDYVVDGVPHVSTTQYEKSMEGYYANQKTLTFAPGTRHRIWYRPGDPKAIRLDFNDTSKIFGASIGLVIGPLCLAGGAFMVRKQLLSGKS